MASLHKYKYNNVRIGADAVIESSAEYNISIIGLGKLGQALASQVAGCTLKGWDVIDTSHDCQTNTLYEAIENADTIFITVPSQHFQSTVTNIIREFSNHRRWHTATRVNFISFTKGFCNRRLPIEVLARELPSNPIGVISGPMLSEELYDRHTHAVLATTTIDAHSFSAINCRMGNVTLYESEDVTGVTMCGIVKNVYAIGMGIIVGSELGDNASGCFAAMALKEMSQFVSDDLLTYSGVGDFLTTCYSTESRNYTYGYELANNRSVDGIMSEGANNIDNVIEYSSANLPVVHAIKSCLMSRSVDPLQVLLNQYHAL
jgi:glycerol-3-phosphate dehydrogenase (NAD(P)+)